MIGNLLIREGYLSDFDNVNPILTEVDQFHQNIVPEHFTVADDPAWAQNFYSTLINSNDSCVFLAFSDNQIVGVLYGVIREISQPNRVHRKFGLLDTLSITETYKRKGIGKALMQHFEKWCKEREIHEIELQVYHFNNAGYAFYTSLGFTPLAYRLHRNF